MGGKVCRKNGCFRDIGISESFWIRAWFLASFAKGNSHGYDLINSFSTLLSIDSQNPYVMGNYYRILRDLEVNGFVTSKWNIEGNGPARRIYSITEKGKTEVHSTIQYIKQTKEFIEKFLEFLGEEVK